MNKYILFTLFLCQGYFAKAQFLLVQKNVSQVIQMEDSLSSINLGYQEVTAYSANFSLSPGGDKIYYPICFKRMDEDFSPACKLLYFYAGKDSTIAAINYNWDIMNYLENPDKDYPKIQVELDRRSEYIQKYKSLINKFNNILGKPEYADELNRTLENNFAGSCLWKDSLRIVFLYITFIPPNNFIPEYKHGKASLSVVIQWQTNPSDLMMYAKNNSSYMVFPAPDHFAAFKGGESNLLDFIKSNIKYPKEARKKGIHGTVNISFAIDANGNVINSKVAKGIGEGCDEEALRVVNMMNRKWEPATKDGKNINSMYNLPINFKLD